MSAELPPLICPGGSRLVFPFGQHSGKLGPVLRRQLPQRRRQPFEVVIVSPTRRSGTSIGISARTVARNPFGLSIFRAVPLAF